MSWALLHSMAVFAAALEDPALAVVAGVLFGGVVDLLEHPRYRHHQGRLEDREGGNEVLDVAGEPEGDLARERRDGDGARQHVREREEDEHPFALVQQRREAVLGAADLVEQVGMGQLAALRPAGGARGVDQGRGIGGLQAGQPVVELLRVDRLGRVGQRVQRCHVRPVDTQHLAQRGQLIGEVLDLVGVGIGLGEYQHRAGILQHELDLFGGARLIDRHRDRARGQDGEVQDRPFVTGRRQYGDPVTGRHALGDQPQCCRTDLVCSLLACDIRPCAVDEALEDHMVGIVAFVAEHGADDVVVLAHGERGGNTELTHDHASRLAALPPQRCAAQQAGPA